VWTGGGAGPQWSIGGNWQGGAAPVPGPLTSLTFDGSVTQTVNDFQPGSFFSNLTFAASSAPFNLSGNPFILCGNLANNSTGRQRIAADVAWSGVSRTLDTGAGDVVLAGHLTSGAGNAAFTKNGSGRLILEGGANFTAVDASCCSVERGRDAIRFHARASAVCVGPRITTSCGVAAWQNRIRGYRDEQSNLANDLGFSETHLCAGGEARQGCGCSGA
jgi:hypothetical protein